MGNDVNGFPIGKGDLVKGVIDNIVYRVVSIDQRGYAIIACGRTVKRISPRRVIWLSTN